MMMMIIIISYINWNESIFNQNQ